MKIKLNLKVGRWVCTIQKAQYENGATALLLNDATTGERVCKATVNIPEADLHPGEVIIKDYGENEGVLQSLIDHNIIGLVKLKIPTGYCYGNLVDLKPESEWKGLPV